MSRSSLSLVIVALALGGCAVPATDVQVATMPMQEALKRSRTDQGLPAPEPANAPARAAPRLPPEVPQAQIGTPEIRMAYFYEWIDADGNRHFGEWVAIPLAGFDWIMNDGSRLPVEPDNAAGGGAREAR